MNILDVASSETSAVVVPQSSVHILRETLVKWIIKDSLPFVTNSEKRSISMILSIKILVKGYTRK
ncbi:34882_t:CDS:2 [Racocetra persica]|uniref:34882_t:CDS:1 n=1 Tax=Racocetra persica TaxID=160502 RepID=A0ACA9N5K5_9GLOM|nr:34882_t:CDS:2 [Racocetra persica]